MPLPSNYDKVPVKGKYVYLDGTPAQGQVKFTGKVVAVSDAADTVILPNTIVANLDINGAFTVNLPATNDADILPNGWTYTVAEQFVGGGGRTYEIDVPLSALPNGIDLSDVAPRSASSGTPTAFVTLTAFNNHVAEASEGSGVSSWTDLTDKPTTFPPSAHSHAQSDVTGLSTALAGKADTGHSHVIANVSGLQAALDAKWDILVLAPGAPVPGGPRANKTLIFRTA